MRGLFARGAPVVARFSNFTGIPDIADNTASANPRGLALKILTPDGSELDLVTHSFNGFPVATSEEFFQLLQAIASSGSGAAPHALEAFLAAHPIAKTFLTTQPAIPVSYATTPYYGVNTYRFTDPAGQDTDVRFRFVPEAGEASLAPDEATAKGPDFLQGEIATRVSGSVVSFRWYAQLAGPGDVLDDPATAWPDDRELVELGRVDLDRVEPDPAGSDRWLLFLPGSVVPGIAVADPMLNVRNASYPVSFAQRR